MCQVDVSQTKYEVLVKTNLRNMDKIIQYSISIAVFCLQNLICLLVIFADQVFIDPSFLGIFVYGPLQSFVVNGGSLNNRTAERRGGQNTCPRLGFQIFGTGLQSLSVELGYLIPLSCEIPDSLSCFPDSKSNNFPNS